MNLTTYPIFIIGILIFLTFIIFIIPKNMNIIKKIIGVFEIIIIFAGVLFFITLPFCHREKINTKYTSYCLTSLYKDRFEYYDNDNNLNVISINNEMIKNNIEIDENDNYYNLLTIEEYDEYIISIFPVITHKETYHLFLNRQTYNRFINIDSNILDN